MSDIIFKEGAMVAVGFVPEDVCQALIEYYNTAPDYAHFDCELRNSESVALPTPDIVRPYMEELFTIYRSEYNASDDYYYSKDTIIAKYSKGDYCRPHHDGTNIYGAARAFTTPLILNDNYKGGELMLTRQRLVAKQAGTVAIFPSNFLYPHTVLPVVEGNRYSFLGCILEDRDYNKTVENHGFLL